MDNELLTLLFTFIALLLLLYLRRRQNRPTRSFWVHPWNRARNDRGAYSLLVQELRTYPDKYRKFMRLTPESFDEISRLISPRVIKKDTHMRLAIPVPARLAVTLYYLVTGSTYCNIHIHYRIGVSTSAGIIHEVCTAIWEVMSPVYLRQPQTEQDWRKIASGFWDSWNFPNCLGAIDGKHVQIKKPPGSGSEWFCYKKVMSMNLMAICDAHYRFIMVDIGQRGSESDGGVWESSEFGAALSRGDIPLPPPSPLPGTNVLTNYAFVADDAFPLKIYLMKPFPGREMGARERKVFNYRLSRARRTIENAFGILCQRWRALLSPIQMHPHNARMVVAAACVLHNYLLYQKDEEYVPPGSTDQLTGSSEGATGEWRNHETERLPGANPTAQHNPTVMASVLRQRLCTFFSREGRLDFQDAYIDRRVSRPRRR